MFQGHLWDIRLIQGLIVFAPRFCETTIVMIETKHQLMALVHGYFG